MKRGLKSNYNMLVSEFEGISSSIKGFTIWLIVSFTISLIVCLIGLLVSANEVLVYDWTYIALVLVAITVAMHFFNAAWNELQGVSDSLDKLFLFYRAVARIYGKPTGDNNTESNAKTDRST